jgi:hypothetical protein
MKMATNDDPEQCRPMLVLHDPPNSTSTTPSSSPSMNTRANNVHQKPWDRYFMTIIIVLVSLVFSYIGMRYTYHETNKHNEKDVNVNVVNYTHHADTSSHETNKHNEKDVNVNVVNYMHHADTFVDVIFDCIMDENCHVQMIHTKKTGGNTIEDRIFEFFPDTEYNTGTCCNENGLTPHFKEEITTDCNRPFSSYQLFGDLFANEVIPTCLKEYEKKNTDSAAAGTTTTTSSPHRMVVLASFREPIFQSLSWIHQKCNKRFNARSKELQGMCQRCNFDEDQIQWETFVDGTNRLYDRLYQHVILGTAHLNFPVLIIDTVDITAFFNKLKTKLPDSVSSKLKEDTVKNAEKLGLCDFGFHSRLMKRLYPSMEVYRQLITLGAK